VFGDKGIHLIDQYAVDRVDLYIADVLGKLRVDLMQDPSYNMNIGAVGDDDCDFVCLIERMRKDRSAQRAIYLRHAVA